MPGGRIRAFPARTYRQHPEALMTTAGDRIVRSRRPAVDVPEVAVPDFLLDHAAVRRDAPAVVDGSSGRTLTYGELRRDVQRFAGGLHARGRRPGDVLAIVAPNSPEWLVACYG